VDLLEPDRVAKHFYNSEVSGLSEVIMFFSLFWLALSVHSEVPVPMWYAETIAAKTLPASEGRRLTAAELTGIRDSKPQIPFRDVTTGIRLADGSLWVGTQNGLCLLGGNQDEWRLFHSRRWLPDNRVLDLAVTSDGIVFVQTPAGMGKLYQKQKKLEQKMEEIHAELRQRHVREGLVGHISLKEPGRLEAGWFQPDSDNDGLWTSLYVAAEAFRFGATGDGRAKENAWQSLKALMFLEKVTGISGYAARTIWPGTEPKPHYGEWHRSADGKWWWKGDTSSDELDGHYIAYSVYYDLAATPAEKEQIRLVVERITDHILKHCYYYVGPSGKRARWGVWAPEKLNRDLAWIEDRGLNSLEILSHLKVADHISGKPCYAEAAKQLVEQHGYALNTVWQKAVWPPRINHSDDQLAFISYYPLMIYERDPKLREIYLVSLERSWRIERPEMSPLFNLIYAACRQASNWKEPGKRPKSAELDAREYDGQVCRDWFRDVPQDLIEWTVKNSNRQDIGPVATNRHRRATGSRVLNVAERPLMRWNGDPYQLDGGSDGRNRDDGTFILLPYWLGRYHRLSP